MAEHDTNERLPPEVAALLGRESRAYAEDDALHAQVRRRMELHLAIAAAASPSEPAPAEPVAKEGPPLAPARSARLGRDGLAASTVKVVALSSTASLLVGAAIGAAAAQAWMSAPAAEEQTEISAARSEAQTSAPMSAAPTTSAALPDARTADDARPREADAPPIVDVDALPIVQPSAGSAVPRGKTDLRREREMVDAARAALTAGRIEEATRALDRHRRAFPAGQLAEEREALRVLALVRAGNRAEAEAAAARFARDFPASGLLPGIEAAVRAP